MRKSKYIGKVYDGVWKVVSLKRYKESSNAQYCILENIYNHKQLKIRYATLYKLDKGETTVSKIIRTHIRCKIEDLGEK